MLGRHWTEGAWGNVILPGPKTREGRGFLLIALGVFTLHRIFRLLFFLDHCHSCIYGTPMCPVCSSNFVWILWTRNFGAPLVLLSQSTLFIGPFSEELFLFCASTLIHYSNFSYFHVSPHSSSGEWNAWRTSKLGPTTGAMAAFPDHISTPFSIHSGLLTNKRYLYDEMDTCLHLHHKDTLHLNPKED